MADVLTSNPFIRTLNFQFNEIGDTGSEILAEALHFNTSLTSLNLSNDRIGPKGARALSNMLRFNATLETLSLQHNVLCDLGARLLAEALAVNSTLQVNAIISCLIFIIGICHHCFITRLCCVLTFVYIFIGAGRGRQYNRPSGIPGLS